MTTGADAADTQRRALGVAFSRSGITLDDLWMRYFALGGTAGALEVEAFLDGLMPLPEQERDILAHAVNERLDDLTTRLRVPYSRPPRAPGGSDGPLAALVGLLDGTQHAAPERVVRQLAAAGAAMGVGISLHLVDYAQRELVPVAPAPGGGIVAGTSLKVDSTMAGQSFQRGRPQLSTGGDRPCLWVPVLDGVERLGVLEVTAPDVRDLEDPLLGRDCRRVANLVGHLVTAANAFGDVLDTVRRRERRSMAAELVWEILPPLTAGTDHVTVAGQLEPAHDVGGDAFDYALSERTVHLAIFDATGHSLASGLAATAAMTAYRNIRRAGGGLYDQATAVDETIATQFADRPMFVSAILVELDVATGRLRYLIGGHPRPLVVRRGRVVKTLTGGTRGMFGMRHPAMSVAEEVRQPGDSLLLYTDGVTEARDQHGRFFGVERLHSFLERAASADFPPPETVRRLVREVMTHQNGMLQDDATVLLTSWLPHAADLSAARALDV